MDFLLIIDWIWEFILKLFDEYKDSLKYGLYFLVAATIFAISKTVDEDQRGLKYSFGRVRKVVEPGFHFMIPFVQKIRLVTIRSKTLDLEKQKIVTRDGLVYQLDVSLVYRIEDVQLALIQIDDLTEGMKNALTISIQKVMVTLNREELNDREELGNRLLTTMQEMCSMWGVKILEADFVNISPSQKTTKLLQLQTLMDKKKEAFLKLVAGGIPELEALTLLGSRRFYRNRMNRALRNEFQFRLLRDKNKDSFLKSMIPRVLVLDEEEPENKSEL